MDFIFSALATRSKSKKTSPSKNSINRFSLLITIIVLAANFCTSINQISAQEMSSKMPSNDHKTYPTIDLMRNWAGMQLQYLSQAAQQELPLDALNANPDKLNTQLNHNEQDEAHEIAAVAFEWLNKRSPQEKTVVWLLYLQRNLTGAQEDGGELHGFFFLWNGYFAPEISKALHDAGLKQRAEIFDRAMALMGNPYPRSSEIREQSFAWSQPNIVVNEVISIPHDLNSFDKKLISIGAEFNKVGNFDDEITNYLNSVPQLVVLQKELAAKISDEQRLMTLIRLIFTDYANDPKRDINNFNEPYREIFLLNYLMMEMENGSLHQYFYNSSGDNAPETLEVLKKYKLEEDAEIFAQALAMFKSPYPKDRMTRSKEYFSKAEWTQWDDDLGTFELDTDTIIDTMMKIAQDNDLLPQ
ncbi:DMP19 family protein [Bartonella sp. HY329]|uniref:DMP19 family protein n=1 Tax=unclassified Bartonella TaxID=2645622 RepID=UPI0021CA3806|nr:MULTISPECIES: DMP19 family protein [unclassified Bartonella]UXM95785.1 DMP19 family protein [Bartonella sp. HY329]UXN10110.1 DMP19 family protein [Bartonella sp. HY328]